MAFSSSSCSRVVDCLYTKVACISDLEDIQRKRKKPLPNLVYDEPVAMQTTGLNRFIENSQPVCILSFALPKSDLILYSCNCIKQVCSLKGTSD